MREEFEAWYENEPDRTTATKCAMWNAWKASRAALYVELPCSLGYPNNDMVYLSDVEERLEKAGVSCK